MKKTLIVLVVLVGFIGLNIGIHEYYEYNHSNERKGIYMKMEIETGTKITDDYMRDLIDRAEMSEI